MTDPLSDFDMDIETVTVITDGKEQRKVECLWTDDTVLFRACDVKVNFDSVIEREYPTGVVEFQVLDPGYQKAQLDFIEMYQAKISKKAPDTSSPPHYCGMHGNTFVVSDNARINISSTDQSTNIQQTTSLDELRQELCTKVPDLELKLELLNLLEKAEKGEDLNAKKQAVDSFLTRSASIMSIVSPFIPALTGLISS